ncbi:MULTISPECIES: DUF3168 domain-containing protein [Staphylococcus]|uniref:DUF3168 domain-containing protein n=1 Tax=Staphylococcus TaxID=1279 RepID=UPI00076B7B19|nr:MULTISPECIES: DUF3168 domain-containing protein [Staphylococcus]DAH60885.1 MAG TPA: hypothetical protein [Caudoviricetes sp.]AMG64676.1 DUF3168 domain-containing protein [Staphylococcus lugdunensis]MCH8657740.1 DUF3168 domain-containing protein [Staphylococcus lugdunensis]MCH8668196.1 DUF3168 domain-containing protein [Staphylococcus lugdunensis]MCI2813846.1 DUF3168 domain-containing protein [Staphylococcus lugdunensis]
MWVSVEPELTNQLYKRLKDSPIINKLVGDRVFDVVQDEARYPYIVLGESNVTNNESSAMMRETVGIVFHVYSQYPTQYETKLIISAIGHVINRPIEIDNYEFRFSRIDSQAVFPDIDRFTKHGTIRLLFNYRHKKINEEV